MKDYLNQKVHSRNTLFNRKRWLKKGYYVNECFGLSWDRIEVYEEAAFNTIGKIFSIRNSVNGSRKNKDISFCYSKKSAVKEEMIIQNL